MAKMAFWFLVLAVCGILDFGLAEDEDPEAFLVRSKNCSDREWPEVMYFPDAEDEPKRGRVHGEAYVIRPSRRDVTFKLFTRQGPRKGETLSIGNLTQLTGSTFNSSQRTFLLTHGFQSNVKSNAIQSIKNMYIGFKEGNVVAVDWSRIASNPLYFVVKKQTVDVGGFVAGFVTFLVREGGVNLDSVHLIGHSLGAHVMGIAGKGVMLSLHSKVDRITGLDPAGPLYCFSEADDRLDRSDGEFVDVIHTCSGGLGIAKAIGHVDFFPNGGSMSQPGCSMDLTGACAHERSWRYFAESINSLNFTSLRCESYDDFLQKNCDPEWRAPMGDPAPKGTEGKYFLKTSTRSPYALG